MEQGEIVGWLVEVGEPFERGQAILEVETDKTVVEYPALGAGVLREVLAEEGDTIDVGAAIASVDIGDAADWTVDVKATDEPPATKSETMTRAAVQDSRDTAGRFRATPAARRLARNAGVELHDVVGTGRRGRIEGIDIENVSAEPGGVQFTHDIAYVRSGPVLGPKFLLLHGFAADHTAFSLMSNGLAKAGCDVIACDLPGHGESALEAASPEELSQNLGEFVRSQFGKKPYHLVAHSMGAIAALALANFVRPASMTLISPVGFGKAGDPGFLNGMASPRSVDDMRRLLDQLTEKPNGLSEKAVNAVFQEQKKGRLVGLAGALGKYSSDNIIGLKVLAKTLPIRILVGQDDRILKAADPFSFPPEIAVHSFSKTGHMPHWESPRAVLNILLGATGNAAS